MRTNKIAIALGIAAVVFLGLSILVGGLAMVATHRSPAAATWQRGYSQPRSGAADTACPMLSDRAYGTCYEGAAPRGRVPGTRGQRRGGYDEPAWGHEDCPYATPQRQDALPGPRGNMPGPRRGYPDQNDAPAAPDWREGMPGRGGGMSPGGGMMGPRYHQDGQ